LARSEARRRGSTLAGDQRRLGRLDRQDRARHEAEDVVGGHQEDLLAVEADDLASTELPG
jgi:hypothetical protein